MNRKFLIKIAWTPQKLIKVKYIIIDKKEKKSKRMPMDGSTMINPKEFFLT